MTQNIETLQSLSESSHLHYSNEVQELVEGFNRSYRGIFLIGYCAFNERVIYIEALQAAWNLLVKARKRETGCGAYLTPERYAVAVKALKNSLTN